MKKLTSIIVLFLMTVQVVNAQIAGHNYAKVISEDCDVNISDDEFYEIARSVTFPINEYSIPKNSGLYREILNEIVPAMNVAQCRLYKIIMRGAASPDGAYVNNRTLANKRQKALFNTINSLMDIPTGEDCITVLNVGEDYHYLVRQMGKAKDKDYALVKAIVDHNADDIVALKTKLHSANQGLLWRRLIKEYFPSMRTAHVMLYFKKAMNYAYVPNMNGNFSQVESCVEKLLADNSLQVTIPTPDVAVMPAKEEVLAPMPIEPQVVEDSKAKEPKVKEPKVKDQRSKIKDLEKESKPSTFNLQPSTHIHFPVLAVKTNLLYDGFYTPKTGFEPIPNVELEYYFHNGAFSILAEYEFPWWRHEEREEFFQMQNWQLEPRFYFKHDHYFNGFYVGAYANFNRFDFALKGNNGSGVQGEGAGAGLSIGYVVPLGKKSSRFKLEFNIKAGYYETRYDPYDYEYSVEKGEGKYYYRWWDSPTAFRRRNWRYRWMGPTGAGITFSYDLFRRTKK